MTQTHTPTGQYQDWNSCNLKAGCARAEPPHEEGLATNWAGSEPSLKAHLQ